MRFSVLVLVAACGNHAETSTPAQPTARVGGAAIDAGVPVHVVNASHSGAIGLVAVADDAKAAITSDDNGELRFWPALDGLSEPVAIHGRVPQSLVLAHAGDGYIAALLDEAGGVEVLQLTAQGAVRGRRVIAAEPAFESIAATSDAILARRSDHRIVRLDVSSEPLAPQMGEQILALAARRNVAVVGLADPEHPEEIREVRQIALARDLAWGAAYTLPVPLKAPIAVSPSGRRIAGLDARSGAGTIIELLGQPRVITSDLIGNSNVEQPLIGFLDDERAAFPGGIVLTAPTVTAVADPWSAVRSSTRLRIGRSPTVTNDAVISGHGTSLILADPSNTMFLGYRDTTTGFLRVTPKAITYGLGNRVIWLDEDLHDRRARDVTNDATSGLAVDDHRLLKGTYTYLETDRSKLDVALVDASSGLEVQLGTWAGASSVTYDPDTRVLAITGYTTTIPRVLLDVEAAKVTAIRPLKTRRDAGVELFDPSVANGIVAISTGYDGDAVVHETFVDDNKQTTTKPLTATSMTRLVNAVTIGFDRTGAIYAMQLMGDKPTHVAVFRGGKEVKRWRVTETLAAGTVDRAGTQIAMSTTTHVVMFDTDGHERWRAPMWAEQAMRFTADGTKLIVNTGGGLVTLDAATGARLATACGWGFGLSTTEPSLSTYNVPVVCAEGS